LVRLKLSDSASLLATQVFSSSIASETFSWGKRFLRKPYIVLLTQGCTKKYVLSRVYLFAAEGT
jgi:hypothetical protein